MDIKKITLETDLDILSFNLLLDPGKVWDLEQGKKYVSDPNNALFVAVVENHYVGFATAHRLQRFDQRKAEVLLYEIGTDEAFRRQGIASALIATVKEWAKEVGADTVWVLTEKDNQPAIGLYSSTGGKEDTPQTMMFTYAID